MLSRFSKLPGFSSLLTNNSYSPKAIEQAVSEIKKAGKANSTNDDTLQAINNILALMKKFSDSLQIQRVACHALSNLAMQVVVARWIVQRGGFNLIKKALLRFESDHKLCWLGSSAVWNLARPPNNRAAIGVDAVKVMMRMLRNHHHREKVTNTAIGALSNLSLCNQLKSEIAVAANVQFIMHILNRYVGKRSMQVMTSGAGLIANLAVSDDHASLLVSQGALPVVLQLLAWNIQTNEPTLYRNTCAALNNMVTASRFLDVFLESRGIESVFEFLARNTDTLYFNLLENCLINIEVDIHETTTSFHLCSIHGKLEILQDLLQKYPCTDLDALDTKCMTCMDYALLAKHKDIVHFLSKCGAKRYQMRYLNESADEEEQQKLTALIQSGAEVLEGVRFCHENALYQTIKTFPKHLCKMITSYQNNIELLESIDQY